MKMHVTLLPILIVSTAIGCSKMSRRTEEPPPPVSMAPASSEQDVPVAPQTESRRETKVAAVAPARVETPPPPPPQNPMPSETPMVAETRPEEVGVIRRTFLPTLLIVLVVGALWAVFKPSGRAPSRVAHTT